MANLETSMSMVSAKMWIKVKEIQLHFKYFPHLHILCKYIPINDGSSVNALERTKCHISYSLELGEMWGEFDTDSLHSQSGHKA